MSQDGKCGACGKTLGPFDSIAVAGVGERCYPCFNRDMADRIGVDFDNTPLQPIVIDDADGVPHTFQIRSMLVATGHTMEALEITNDGQLGYGFRVLGDVEDFDLRLRLSRVSSISPLCDSTARLSSNRTVSTWTPVGTFASRAA